MLLCIVESADLGVSCIRVDQRGSLGHLQLAVSDAAVPSHLTSDARLGTENIGHRLGNVRGNIHGVHRHLSRGRIVRSKGHDETEEASRFEEEVVGLV